MRIQKASGKKRAKKEESGSKASKKRRRNDDDDDDDEDEDVENLVFRRGLSLFFQASVTTKSVTRLRIILDEAIEDAFRVKNNFTAPIICLNISSPGGDVFAGISAYTTLKSSPIPVYTVVDGHVASAATFLLLAGKKRFGILGSHILVHQLSTDAAGNFGEVGDDYKNCKLIMKTMKKIYLSETGIDKESLKTMLSNEKDMSMKSAVKLGFLHGPLPL